MIHKEINWEWKRCHYYVAAAESQAKMNLILIPTQLFLSVRLRYLVGENWNFLKDKMIYTIKTDNQPWFHFIK